jgi:hypothetical protein
VWFNCANCGQSSLMAGRIFMTLSHTLESKSARRLAEMGSSKAATS